MSRTETLVKPLVDATLLAERLSEKDGGRITVMIWLRSHGFTIEAKTVLGEEVLRQWKVIGFDEVFRAVGPILATAVQHTHDLLEQGRADYESAAA